MNPKHRTNDGLTAMKNQNLLHNFLEHVFCCFSC